MPAVTSRRRALFLHRAALGILLLATHSGCTEHIYTESARVRGAAVGQEEGRRKGEAEGYQSAALSASNDRYRARIRLLCAAGEHHTVALYSVGALVGSALLGFFAQYVILYVPRRLGFLYDIDRLVLPARATEVNLHRLANQPSISTAPDLRKSIPLLLLVCTALLASSSCGNPESKAWQAGYETNYAVAYQEGWREGERRGRPDGDERGAAAAERAAVSGAAWQFYSTEMIWGFISGFAAGLFGQYGILICCGTSGRVAQFLTVAFVPAMKHSLSYALFERRRAVMLELAEALLQVRVKNKLQLAQIRAVRDNVARQLQAITSIEELNAAHLVELARQEISDIVASSEEEANREQPMAPADETTDPFFYNCPWCQTRNQYIRHSEYRTVICANEHCGQHFTLPPSEVPGGNARPIVFADGD